jgi:hypothetical protein
MLAAQINSDEGATPVRANGEVRNGHSRKQDPNKRVLTEQESNELRMINRALAGIKAGLGDIAFQETLLLKKKSELAMQFQQLEQDLNAKVREISLAHGIDPDGNPETARWNLDLETMKFSRVV